MFTIQKYNLVMLALSTSVAQAQNADFTVPATTIYATKQPESALDVPATVDVLDKNRLSQLPVNDLYDVGRALSNVAVQQGGFYKSINIRGIGGGGRNAGFSTRVGVYLDGVYVGQTLALDSPIFNAEQIEILKGPQGYLFGNNSNAGAINIVSSPASHTSQANVSAGVGNYGFFQTLLSLNGEISPAMTGRLVMSHQTRDGYVINQFDGSDLKGFENNAIRGILNLEATDKLNLKLSVDYTNKTHSQFLAQALTGLFGQPINTQTNRFDKINRNLNPQAHLTAGGVHLNADYFLDNTTTLHAISAYRHYTNNIVQDNDYDSVDLASSTYHDQVSQYSQELRVDTALESGLRYNLGLYFLREINSNASQLILGKDTNTLVTLPAVGFPLPFGTVFGVNANTVLPMRGKVTTDNIALFSSVDYPFMPNWVLHAGARASTEQKQLDLFMDGRQSGLLNMAFINHQRQQQANGFFSPMLGLSYHPDAQTQLYITTARAYKSGGWNVEFMTQAQANDGYAYAPESVSSVELGFKRITPESALQLSVFHNQINNYQVFQYTNLGGPTLLLQLRNAAQAVTQGAEISARQTLNDHLGLQASLAYLDAHYQDFPNGNANGQNIRGNPLPDAPKWSASLMPSYQFHSDDLGATFSFAWQIYAQSQTTSGLNSDNSINHIAGRILQDASLSVVTDSRKWQWQLWVKNITDKQYPLAKGSDAFSNVFAIYGDPRLYGIMGQYHF